MYFFVRFAAIVTIVFGILFMLAGVGASVYGFMQNDAVTEMVNTMLVETNIRVLNAGVAGALAGLALFIQGMMLAAVGQLLLVFIDIANSTRETNLIMRSFRRREE